MLSFNSLSFCVKLRLLCLRGSIVLLEKKEQSLPTVEFKMNINITRQGLFRYPIISSPNYPTISTVILR